MHQRTVRAPGTWEFGDGGTSTSQNPVYTYSAAAAYTVNLTASNGDGI